ncbi:hypothetical protein [Vagococcus fluvialis]|uniref:hypothetical protein n=1 Tax=Vagococcus fluvialis TaxID=2738 RepID=UPI002033E3E3|nr:hypothetical protein [Vagococcus fluvialis]MCM2139906.1 hypothetical protein [Vagococcus fluvialis]
MIVKTLHVKERRQKKVFEIYPNQKEYTFRVDKKIEDKMKVGKLVRFSKQQLLYVTEVITDCEDEEQYTGTVKRIVKLKNRPIIFLTDDDLEERRIEREKQAKKQQNIANHTKKICVAQGTYLMMEGKKFRNLNKIVKVEVNKNIQKWVQIGDILYIHYVNKNGNNVYRYVLVQEIIPDFLITRKKTECEVVHHYYQKTAKGYVKTMLQKNGLPVPPKKIAAKKKKPKKQSSKDEDKQVVPLSRKKEAEKNKSGHSWTMRQRNSDSPGDIN